MKNTNLIWIAVFALFVACNQKASDQVTQTDSSTFGEEITSENAMSLVNLMKEMEKTDSMQVKVRGTVEDVCQKKGCWMNIVSADTDDKMFVKFKDYGFFMPFDIAGREVIMDGYALKEITSVDELRHYAEDAGKTAAEIAAITEPEKSLKFMASGVILVDEGE